MIIAELLAIPSSFANQNQEPNAFTKKKKDKTTTKIARQVNMFEFSGGTKLPVANGLAARALLGAGIVAVGANGVVASENVGHWGAMRSLTSSNSFEIGVDLKVLGGRVLHEMQQSDGDDENRQKQLKEPILVQRHCRDKHLRRCLFDPRPRVFHRSQSNLFFFFN